MMRYPIVAAIVFGMAGAGAAEDAKAPLRPLPDDQVVLTLHANGVQIYECRADPGGALAWTFKAPRADLFLGGERVGRHFAGPSWEHRDGSRITGKVEAKAESPDIASIPWLRLGVETHAGEGVFSGIGAVLRVNTGGGMKQGRCSDPGAVFDAPYQADYVFVRRP